ncbi:MFS transporter [Streptomyces sp. JB150]|uniref:MFS transporter n=1 Tax=Streptomyces sp. JB150 TaxID=2714844 RepID=UPI00140E7F53|nr:MFS transporter [Streptomyces sp. JB150]QIJ61135.1 MFS transporter [Streptomyces sp. JB150]
MATEEGRAIEQGPLTTAGDAAEPLPGPAPAARPAFALLGCLQVTLIFTLASVAVPLPEIGRRFGLGREELILLSAAYGLAFAGLLLSGGRLADRYGGRRTLLAGLLLFGAASVAAPLAPAYPPLLAARFAQGAGAALVAPAAMAVLRTLFPAPPAYRRAMATWGGLSVLGATAGNLLSGVISALLSWRWAFAAPLAVTALALPLAPRLLPADRPRARDFPGSLDARAARDPSGSPDGRDLSGSPGGRVPRLDLPGALLATAGIVAVSYGLVLTDARPWSSAHVLGPLSAGGALLVVFAVVERRTADPLLPPGFLRDARRVLGLVATALTAAGTSTVFVLFSLHLQQERGWSALSASAAFVPFAAVLLGCGRVAGRFVARHGPAAVTGGGLAAGAAGLGLLALTGFDAEVPYGYGVLPGLVLLPAGAAAAFAGAAVLATDRVPAARTGLAGGVHNTAMEVGPTLLFALLLAAGGDRASLAAAAGLFALAVPLLRLARP